MVRIGTLWRKPRFQSLDDTSKLLYLYLAAYPGLNTVGVCCLNINILSIELTKTIEELREAATKLIEQGYILTCNTKEGVYFCVLEHYQTMPRSDLTVRKAKNEINTVPAPIKEKLLDRVNLDAKKVVFNEPTETEVIEYGLSQGVIVDGAKFIAYYKNTATALGKTEGWFDSGGKQVRDWQAKLRNVWFRNSERIRECPDAPEGFNFFYAELDGKPVFPDFWEDGKPKSREGLIVTKKLQEEYERKRSS